jgi:hypothetical protein
VSGGGVWLICARERAGRRRRRRRWEVYILSA